MCKKKWSRRLAAAGICLIWCFSAVWALADWMQTQSARTETETGTLTGELVITGAKEEEDFRRIAEDEYYMPYQVHVQNTGTSDMFIRIRVEKYWAERLAEEMQEIYDRQPGYYNEYDRQRGFAKIDGDYADKQKIQLLMEEQQRWDDYWLAVSDPQEQEQIWYYYRDVLEPGEVTQFPMMTAYMASALDSEYQDLAARVEVELECLQAEADAILYVWGISYEELGVDYVPSNAVQEGAEVIFLSPDEGFMISDQENQLLGSMTGLVPGTWKVSAFSLHNRYEEPVDIEVYLEYQGEGEGAGEDGQLLARRLMEEFSQLTLINQKDDAVLYQGPVQSKSLGTIHLGAGETISLSQAFGIRAELGNEYQELTGMFRWQFTARGEDGSSPGGVGGGTQNPGKGGSGSGLKTGDAMNWIPYLLFLAMSLILLSYGSIRRCHRKKEAAVTEESQREKKRN